MVKNEKTLKINENIENELTENFKKFNINTVNFLL
jgi:hypothetical protein